MSPSGDGSFAYRVGLTLVGRPIGHVHGYKECADVEGTRVCVVLR